MDAAGRRLTDLFRDELVRLSARHPGDAAKLAEWSNDSEFTRFQKPGPVMPQPESDFDESCRSSDSDRVGFMVRTLEDDRLISYATFLDVDRVSGSTMLGIGLADRDYWGRGYGSDALQVVLRYGFQELNLHRIALNVWSLNPRAIRAYEKAGFHREAILRQDTLRDGVRSDSILMSILRHEWLVTRDSSESR
jgi:RimJ/RimL family protein N-acetyltransferase